MITAHTFTENRQSTIWTTQIENYEPINLEILNTLQQHRENNIQGVVDDINVGVWQTEWHMETYSGFDLIADIAKETTSIIAKDFYRYNTFNPKIIDCWSNVYYTDSKCHVHHHFPATFSLVYYVTVPEGSGEIYFPDINQSFLPTEGTLLCFRGDLKHGVNSGTFQGQRVIVGINIINELI